MLHLLPKTRWDWFTLVAAVVAVGYIAAVLITQVYFGWDWSDWLRDATNALFAVALLLLSIRYGGLLTDFYSEVTGFGISRVRVDRHGQDPTLNKLWIDRITSSEEVIIVGTLSKGWFVEAIKHLHDLLDRTKEIKVLSICLLDPFGNVWRSKIESRQHKHRDFLDDVYHVFKNISALAAKHKEVRVQLYDTEPISCVVANEAIYLSLYLPRVDRREIPEFTISLRSFLGDKVYAQSVEKLRASAPVVSPEVLQEYMNTTQKHATSTRERFWSDPEVFCDFCKEPRGLPSEISRRYPTFIDRSRIVVRKQHFFVIPSLGQLADDHALIVSNSHATSSAKLPAAAFTELNSMFEQLQTHADKNNKCQMFFEHGVPSDGSAFGGCGICHCHIHSLPLPADYEPFGGLEEFLLKKSCRFVKHSLASWPDVRAWEKDSFLCVQVGSKARAIHADVFDGPIESQLMRQFIKEKWPHAEKGDDIVEPWDWRRFKNEEEALKASTVRLKQILT